MLAPHWKAIVNEIKNAIRDACSSNADSAKAANEQRSAISAGIKTLSETLNAENIEQQTIDAEKCRRENYTIGALAAAAAFTLALDVLAGCQLLEMRKVYEPIKEQAVAAKTASDAAIRQSENSDKALIQSQRAWVAPLKFSFVDLGNTVEPLKVRILYQNIGHEPAKSVKTWLNSGYIRDPIPSEAFRWSDISTWYGAKEFQPDELCKRVGEDRKTSVAYPSPTFAFTIDVGNPANIPASLIPILFSEVKDQRTVFFVSGCFSYETMNRTKYSTFCAFLNPAGGGKDITEWAFSACPVGNADY
jgi:hypothetical protein